MATVVPEPPAYFIVRYVPGTATAAESITIEPTAKFGFREPISSTADPALFPVKLEALIECVEFLAAIGEQQPPPAAELPASPLEFRTDMRGPELAPLKMPAIMEKLFKRIREVYPEPLLNLLEAYLDVDLRDFRLYTHLSSDDLTTVLEFAAAAEPAAEPVEEAPPAAAEPAAEPVEEASPAAAEPVEEAPPAAAEPAAEPAAEAPPAAAEPAAGPGIFEKLREIVALTAQMNTVKNDPGLSKWLWPAAQNALSGINESVNAAQKSRNEAEIDALKGQLETTIREYTSLKNKIAEVLPLFPEVAAAAAAAPGPGLLGRLLDGMAAWLAAAAAARGCSGAASAATAATQQICAAIADLRAAIAGVRAASAPEPASITAVLDSYLNLLDDMNTIRSIVNFRMNYGDENPAANAMAAQNAAALLDTGGMSGGGVGFSSQAARVAPEFVSIHDNPFFKSDSASKPVSPEEVSVNFEAVSETAPRQLPALRTKMQMLTHNGAQFGPFYQVAKSPAEIDVRRDVRELLEKGNRHYIYSAYGFSGSGKSYTLVKGPTSILNRIIREIRDSPGGGSWEIMMSAYDYYGEIEDNQCVPEQSAATAATAATGLPPVARSRPSSATTVSEPKNKDYYKDYIEILQQNPDIRDYLITKYKFENDKREYSRQDILDLKKKGSISYDDRSKINNFNQQLVKRITTLINTHPTYNYNGKTSTLLNQDKLYLINLLEINTKSTSGGATAALGAEKREYTIFKPGGGHDTFTDIAAFNAARTRAAAWEIADSAAAEQVIGKLTAYLKRTDFGGGGSLPQKYHIRQTPNNDESSRSHLFLDFTITPASAATPAAPLRRITIMDMAGAEDVDVIQRDYFSAIETVKLIKQRDGVDKFTTAPEILYMISDENREAWTQLSTNLGFENVLFKTASATYYDINYYEFAKIIWRLNKYLLNNIPIEFKATLDKFESSLKQIQELNIASINSNVHDILTFIENIKNRPDASKDESAYINELKGYLNKFNINYNNQSYSLPNFDLKYLKAALDPMYAQIRRVHCPLRFQGNFINKTLTEEMPDYLEALARGRAPAAGNPIAMLLGGGGPASDVGGPASDVGGPAGVRQKFVYLTNVRLDFPGAGAQRSARQQNYADALDSSLKMAHCINPFRSKAPGYWTCESETAPPPAPLLPPIRSEAPGTSGLSSAEKERSGVVPSGEIRRVRGGTLQSVPLALIHFEAVSLLVPFAFSLYISEQVAGRLTAVEKRTVARWSSVGFVAAYALTSWIWAQLGVVSWKSYAVHILFVVSITTTFATQWRGKRLSDFYLLIWLISLAAFVFA